MDGATPQEHFTIGELADQFGVSAESLRNWERKGLVPAAQRTPGGHRRYLNTHVQAIAAIMNPPVEATAHA